MKLLRQQLNLEFLPSKGVRDFSSEDFIASRLSESPRGQVLLMESILERENMKKAIKQVIKNKGAPGVAGMSVKSLRGYVKRHWEQIRNALSVGTYYPMPVRQKVIPKEGGVRLPGIPNVLDRLIQQAAAQVLTHIWDYTFSESGSESGFGFRAGRSLVQIIMKLNEYLGGWWNYFRLTCARKGPGVWEK